MSRVVMFVLNDCRTDTRVLREAATLAAVGHQVTIMARPSDLTAQMGEREERADFTIVRVPIPQGWRRRWLFLRAPWRFRDVLAARMRDQLRGGPTGWLRVAAAAAITVVLLPVLVVAALLVYLVRHVPGLGAAGGGVDWLIRWRFSILGWGAAAAAAAPAADVWHGHDLTGLAAARNAHDRSGGLVVYDSHEYFVESGTNARRPRWAKQLFRGLERRWSRDAAALVTVNRTLGDLLGRRLRIRRVVVVHNAPPRWAPTPGAADHLRAAAGIPAVARVALYHGGFSADRGLSELVDAWAQPGLEEAHLVLLGFGPLRDELIARAAEPASGGRIHVLPAVPPEELADWVVSADVGVMPNQPRTLNERLSTPNKLFESLAVGLPVVSSDFPERRRIVIDDPDGPLGAVCDPTDPVALGAAIRSILDLDPAARADLRARCLRAAHERWNWETESARLVGLYVELADEIAAGPSKQGAGV